MVGSDIGIDLGTASILVYIKGKGVVLKEPSVVAFDRDTNKIKAIGEEARLMLGRTPGNIVAVRPLRQGVISDYTVTEKMIKHFIQKALGKKSFRKPLVSVCVPSGVTEVEKKAVEDATFAAGARDVKIIEEPIAAAIGAGIDISRPCGNMIVDIGGGTSDIAVISLGGSVVSTSIKIAGDDFDEALVRYMRKKHNLLIGERTAEDIKIKIGTCYPLAEAETMDVRGRNLVTGLPRTITVSSEETEEALRESTLQIVEAVHAVLEKTPPELAADVADRGIDEGGQFPESDDSFGQTTISAFKLATMIKVSDELLNDSVFNIEQYISREFGRRIGTKEEEAFFIGDGKGKPTGIFNATGGAETGVTSTGTSITFDDVMDLYYSLRAPYRNKAVWLLNDSTVKAIRKLKDGNGNYIWQPSVREGEPDKILNRPYRTSIYVPELAAGNRVMAFGDYSYYWIADRQGRSFKRLNELYATTGQVGFLASERVDGKLILSEAVKTLDIKAAGK